MTFLTFLTKVLLIIRKLFFLNFSKNYKNGGNPVFLLCKIKNTFNHPKIIKCEAPIMKISSSFIRKAISENKDVRYLLTPEVFKYVDEMKFYKL